MECAQPEIEFPVDWTYRILCENTPELRVALKEKVNSLGVDKMEEGNVSKTGKYVTFKVKKIVNSMEELHGFPKALQGISGIKQIL